MDLALDFGFRYAKVWREAPRVLLYYASWLEAVLTYKIRRNDVGIIIKSAVAIRPRILTSILFLDIFFFNVAPSTGFDCVGNH